MTPGVTTSGSEKGELPRQKSDCSPVSDTIILSIGLRFLKNVYTTY